MAWNPQFWDFARYYGFTPRLCRPYRAQTKGKVESGVKYVKRRFVLGRPFPSWDALNPTAQEWVTCVADQRIHGTTFRKPAEAFAEERLRSHRGSPPTVLQTVCCGRWPAIAWSRWRPTATRCPRPMWGQTVEVHWGARGRVQIAHQGTLIATHPRAHGQHQRGVDLAHDALLRRSRAPCRRATSCEPVGATTWTGALPEVAVRALAVYEALLGQEVGHDSSPAPPPAGASRPPQTLYGAGAARNPPPRRQCPGGHVCGLPGSAPDRRGDGQGGESRGDAHRHGPLPLSQDLGELRLWLSARRSIARSSRSWPPGASSSMGSNIVFLGPPGHGENPCGHWAGPESGPAGASDAVHLGDVPHRRADKSLCRESLGGPLASTMPCPSC